jgi:hypothetical protein
MPNNVRSDKRIVYPDRVSAYQAFLQLISFFFTALFAIITIWRERFDAVFYENIRASYCGFPEWAVLILLIMMSLHYARIFLGIAFINGDVSFREGKTQEITRFDTIILGLQLFLSLALPYFLSYHDPWLVISTMLVQILLMFVYTIWYRSILFNANNDSDWKLNYAFLFSEIIFAFTFVIFFVVKPNWGSTLASADNYVSGDRVLAVMFGASAFLFLFELCIQYLTALWNTGTALLSAFWHWQELPMNRNQADQVK